MRSISASPSRAQVPESSAAQSPTRSSRVVTMIPSRRALLIAAFLLIIALGALVLSVTTGPLAYHSIVAPPATQLIVCGGTSWPC
jgi:hypothetical protein